MKYLQQRVTDLPLQKEYHWITLQLLSHGRQVVIAYPQNFFSSESEIKGQVRHERHTLLKNNINCSISEITSSIKFYIHC